MIEDRISTAVARFAEGFNCSQAVLSAYAGMFGLDDATALRLAVGLGGGMGRMGNACGAVTGAMLVLGLRFGAASPDRQAKEAAYARVRQFAEQFAARHGSLCCRDLLGCDLSRPEDLQRATDENLFGAVCPNFVRSACEILEDLLRPNMSH